MRPPRAKLLHHVHGTSRPLFAGLTNARDRQRATTAP
jgi:hypothetical protein